MGKRLKEKGKRLLAFSFSPCSLSPLEDATFPFSVKPNAQEKIVVAEEFGN
jgi:hypothetical protein